MSSIRTTMSNRRLASAAVLLSLSPACSSSPSGNTPDAGADGSSDGSTAAAMCANPGAATPGAADDHCTGADGGLMAVTVDPASCHAAVPADDAGSGAPACPYGDTMYGQTAGDDDCKYRITWSSTPLCRGTAPVVVTVSVTYLASPGMPVTGAATSIEAFTTTPRDAGGDAGYCDNRSTGIDPSNLFMPMTEGPPGTYTGPIYFDQAGQWTMRFHFNEACNDAPTSPHGHAAFYVTLP